jgi:hypothetical protein
MNKKYSIIIMLYLILGLFPETSISATLFECNWDNGTGSSSAVISGNGCFSNVDANPDAFEVINDGNSPGGRNFLRIYDPPSGAWWIRGGANLGNPSILYIRYWWRVTDNTYNYNHHDIVIGTIDNIQSGNTPGFWPQVGQSDGDDPTWPGSRDGLTIEPGVIGPSSHVSYRLGPYANSAWRTMVRGTWYLIEWKIINNPGANDYLYMRVNGVDVTNHLVYYSNVLNNNNGRLDFPDLNYLKINTYDKTGTRTTVEDIAGLKITNGPDWIGGEGWGSGGNDQNAPVAPTALRVIN